MSCSAPAPSILQIWSGWLDYWFCVAARFTVLPGFGPGSFSRGHLIIARHRTSCVASPGRGCLTCDSGWSEIWTLRTVSSPHLQPHRTAPYSGPAGSDQKLGWGAPQDWAMLGEPVGPGGARSPLDEGPTGRAPGERGNKGQLPLTIGINPTIRKIASIAKKDRWERPFIFHFSCALATLTHESLSVCRLNLYPRYLSCLWGSGVN